MKKIISPDDAKYWYINYPKKKSACTHKNWTPLWPPKEIPASATKARFDVYLHEVCLDCGEKRERFVGKTSYGTC